MAAQFKVGTFTGRATNGDVVVTGVGFQPKVIFVQAALTSSWDTFTEHCHQLLGITTGDTATTQWTQNIAAGWDGVATFQNVTRRSLRTDEVLSEITADFGFSNMLATLKTFDSDGFTITFQALGGGANEYTYLAIGGTGVSVKVGSVNWPTSTGNQSVTGVGFQPDLLFLSAGGDAIGGENSTDPGAAWSMGWVDSAGSQGVSAFQEEHAATSNCSRYQRSTKCLAVLDSDTGAIAAEAEFVSYDSDGFTINWTDAHSSAAAYRYLALSGVYSKAGTLTQPSSTGAQAVSGLGIVPIAVMLQSVGATASATVGTGFRYSLGYGSASASASCWNGDEDGTNFAGRRTVRRLSNTAAIVHANPSGTATGSVVADAAVSAVTDGSFTLDWASADATAREVMYLALGAEPAVIRGSAVFGEKTTVTASRAIAFGLDGNTNALEEDGTFKVFGYSVFGGSTLGAGAVPAHGMQIQRNESGSGAAGTLQLVAANGTVYYLWVDATGDLRIHTAAPTEDGTTVSDTAGVVVGSQT